MQNADNARITTTSETPLGQSTLDEAEYTVATTPPFVK
jgi:hypothetical protein